MAKISKKKKILIITEEPDLEYAIRRICLYGKWEPIFIDDYAKGLELCKNHCASLAIVGHPLHTQDSLAIARRIRKLNGIISILVISIDESHKTAEKFIQAGVSDFAIMPVKSPDLFSRIKINLKINEFMMERENQKQQMPIGKGISQATLDIIRNYLNEQREGLTIGEVTNGVNLAYQTVHRYMQYLIEEGEVEILPIYGQLGRPKNKYRVTKKNQREML